jgi:molecular chaperone HtpG
MLKGNISVQTENIFPIIKKFLYSDQEIFLRELVSNAVDATTKLKTLAKRGEISGEIGETNIEIKIDKEAKTLTISDKGIGLTADEAQRYLSEVAFSSASEFMEKYQEGSIIGHFGLGFYSAFMVAKQVVVVSKSFKDEPAVRWTCDGTTEYTIEEADKTSRGSDIILHISDDEMEYLDEHKIEGLLEKYCKFLPVEIVFGTEKNDDVETAKVINNPAPAWKKSPSELKDEDYKSFYSEMYPLSTPPLFWIHLNIDYPFNLTGILYFPKITNAIDAQKSKVQLYCNQVFVTDDVKEILPEFLTLLHGVIDSPDIPLNVSRSYLQSDREVKKITQYITKKVADKLSEIFKSNREDYQQKWGDLGVFVKYGTISDEKFAERSTEFALYRTTDNAFFTLEELKAQLKDTQTDKHNRLILIYTNTPQAHHAQIETAKANGYVVFEMDTIIDNHFMQHTEYKDQNLTFVRVDSDTVDNLVQKDEKRESVLSEDEQKQVKETFESLTKDTSSVNVHVELKPLSPEDQPVQITRNEFMRRMSEMRQFQGMDFGGAMPDSLNLVVNTNHPLVADRLLKITTPSEQANFAQYLYDLAQLQQGMLKGADLTAFVKRSLAFVK